MDAIIAIPTEEANGLESKRSAHFGHAPYFVLVSVVEDEVSDVGVVQNPPHTTGGCMQTVQLLAAQGVTHVSAIGMGRGPLSGFARAGIPVHHDPESATVGQAVATLLAGGGSSFGPDHVCQGH